MTARKPKRIVAKVFPDGVKCPECGWEARTLYRIGMRGNVLACADCTMEQLVREGATVI